MTMPTNKAIRTRSTRWLVLVILSSSWLACDVSDPTEVQKTIAAASDEFGRIDILVNNAGITKRIPTAEFGREDLRQIMEVNFGGAFYCCQAVAKIMMQQNQGDMINIGAFAGLVDAKSHFWSRDEI